MAVDGAAAAGVEVVAVLHNELFPLVLFPSAPFRDDGHLFQSVPAILVHDLGHDVVLPSSFEVDLLDCTRLVPVASPLCAARNTARWVVVPCRPPRAYLDRQGMLLADCWAEEAHCQQMPGRSDPSCLQKAPWEGRAWYVLEEYHTSSRARVCHGMAVKGNQPRSLADLSYRRALSGLLVSQVCVQTVDIRRQRPATLVKHEHSRHKLDQVR